jgi:hypothetical protein
MSSLSLSLAFLYSAVEQLQDRRSSSTFQTGFVRPAGRSLNNTFNDELPAFFLGGNHA